MTTNAKLSISELLIEKYLLNELTASEALQIESVLASDADLRLKVEAMKRENATFLELHPFPSRFRQSTQKEQHSFWTRISPNRRTQFQWTTIACVAAALLLYLSPARHTIVPLDSSDEQVLLKGEEAQLLIYLWQKDSHRLMTSGEWIAPGSRLQLQVRASKETFVSVFSRDSQGTITKHWPEQSNTSQQPLEKVAFNLPHSFELDNSAGVEVFYLATSATIFPISSVVELVEKVERGSFEKETKKVEIGHGIQIRKLIVRKSR